MKNFIPSISIILLFILSHSEILAQTDFSLQMRGGATLIGENKILKYWNRGWNVGVGLEDELVSMVYMSGFIGYHRFSFNMNSYPDEMYRWIHQGKILSSEGTNIYEASFAFRFVSEQGVVRPYILLRSGIYILHTGKIAFQQETFGFVDEYTVDSKTISRLFISLSIGIQIPITKEWNLLIEPSFSQSPPSDLTLFPINAIIQYKL